MPPKNAGQNLTGTKRARSPDAKADKVAATEKMSGTPNGAAAAPAPAAKRVKSSNSLATPISQTKASASAPAPEAAAAAIEENIKDAKDTDAVNSDERNEGKMKPTSVKPETIFCGKFDLYGMELPFIKCEYTSKPGEVNPEALYRTILKYQAQNDRTIKITIPDDYKTQGEGNLHSGVFCEPFGDEPYEISLSRFQNRDELVYTSKYGRPNDAWSGLSLQGALRVTDGGCGISSSSGQIKMQPLWKRLDDKGSLMELFEGVVTFNVSYGAMYHRKGFGNGENHIIPFWAVRAVSK